MAIDTQEVTTVITILPEKKPSQLIREWPEERWIEGAARVRVEGTDWFCAIGILAECAGYEWAPAPPPYLCSCGCNDLADRVVWETPLAFVQARYGLSSDLAHAVMHLNDDAGKDAAARLLELHGF